MECENPSRELSTEEKDHVERSNKKIKTVTEDTNRNDGVEQGVTYMDKLRGTTVDKQSEKSLSSDEEEQEDDLDSTTGVSDKEEEFNSCPKLECSTDELEEWRRPWKLTLLVKLMGKSLGVTFMKGRIEKMWSKAGRVQIIDLENGYYAVTFTNKEDYTHAYQEGLWLIADHYLIVQKWQPNFDPFATMEKTRIAAWIRVPGLPLEYYNVRCLRRVGDLVGKTLKVDPNTSLTSRGKFARICVEINLRRQLVPQVNVCGRNYRVEYEGLHMICFFCGKYGHMKDACSMLKKNHEEINVSNEGQEEPQKAEVEGKIDCGTDGVVREGVFGPWMLVTKQGRRRINNPRKVDASNGNQKGRVPQQAVNKPVQRSNTRFDILGDMEELEATPEHNQTRVTTSRLVLQDISNRQEKNVAKEGGSVKGVQKARTMGVGVIQQQSEVQRPVIMMGKPTAPAKAIIPIANSGKNEKRAGPSRGKVCEGAILSDGSKGSTLSKEPPDKGRQVSRNDASESMMDVEQEDSGKTCHMECDVTNDMAIDGSHVGYDDGGTGARSFPALVRNLRSHYQIEFMALVETHQHGENAKRIIKRMGFTHSAVVEASGQAGGIWCMWSENGFTVRTLVQHEQFIHFQVEMSSMKWFLTVVYGKPQAFRRGELWNNLNSIGASMQDPWCIVGDFNAFVNGSEKFGGSMNGSRPDPQFKECIDRNFLIDLGYSGAGYTWKRGLVAARLDRALANEAWRMKFPEASVLHLPPLKSDHSPVFVRMRDVINNQRNGERPFRVLAAWLLHEDFPNVVHAAWRPNMRWNDARMTTEFFAKLYTVEESNDRFQGPRGLFPSIPEESGKMRCGLKYFAASTSVVKMTCLRGDTARFWTDKWLLEGRALKDYAFGPLTENELEATVSEYTTNLGGWDWRRLEHLLPDDICLKLSSTVPPNRSRCEDKIACSFSNDGKFSTKSAYLYLAGQQDQEEERVWNLIWKWRGSERIRYFLWLCAHDRLMTNEVRKKRNLTENDTCSRCRKGSESLIHMLRDCEKVRTVWMRLINPCHWQNFFQTSHVEWITMNLRLKLGRYAEEWNTVFANACWHIWKTRNTEVFDPTSSHSSDPVFHILQMVRNASQAFATKIMQNQSCRATKLIQWQRPPEGWVKVNVDGARRENDGTASCGGVVRSDHGEFFAGFMRKLGDCSVILAELWGIACGLEVVWDLVFRRVKLETDSLMTVNLLKQQVEEGHPGANLLHKILDLIKQDWEVNITHVYREGNRVANEIASRGIHSGSGTMIFYEQDDILTELIQNDLMGVGVVRHVVV
ncbi:non-LTR retroelement reverse transcriptase-like [Senna tora]|uniref:Non-LTR retroelement reverse transcriptase-like n=1 Tax=Senna tora TaxID=362788 RepID=A0A835CAF7_9FABA|nr:non-LTR retroelement reverse transcriptase-like [Senna tora]